MKSKVSVSGETFAYLIKVLALFTFPIWNVEAMPGDAAAVLQLQVTGMTMKTYTQMVKPPTTGLGT